jgi:enamine deaminase RidA (YjgF/YER057c/UK114 family)
MTAAELVFTGQIAPERTSGMDVAAQAQSAFSRLTAALAGRGLVLDDLLRLRLFVRDLGELPALEEAVDAHVGSRRPAMSVVELPADPAERGVAVMLDAVATSNARVLRRLRPHSVRFGPWVFLSAVTAAEPRRDIPRERRLLHESRALFAHVEEQLREQGARLSDVVKVGGWLTFPMGDYGPLGETRSALVGEAGLLPASAAVQVGRVGRGSERLAFEAIAFVPEDCGRDAGGEDPDKHGGEDQRADEAHPAREAISRLADFYVDARAAGEYVFTSGEVPDGRGSLAEQAREVYERLRAHLAAHGATPADVLQQTVFVRAAEDGKRSDAVADGAVVSEAARAFYGASTSLPPTTLLPVADFGFRPGCDVEVELVAARRSASRWPMIRP